MGCYMSLPDDKVYVTEGKGKNFTYATASCQGWRREQEDAEACIPDFDENSSLFILCDGHGGAEVAKYTVKHLPNFLKNHPLYKEGKYDEALEKAFIDFDAHLRQPEVAAEIAKIAFDEEGNKGNNDENDSMDCARESSCSSNNDKKSGAQSCPAGSSKEPIASGSTSDLTASGSSSGLTASSSTGRPSTSNGASTVVEDVDTETLKREAELPIDEIIKKYADESEVKDRIHSLRQATLRLGASPVIKSKDDQEADCKGQKVSIDQEASSSTSTETKQQAEPSSSKSSISDDGPSSTSSSCGIKEPKTALDIFKRAVEQYFDENDNSEDDSEFAGSDETDSDEDEDDDEDDDDDDDDDEDDDDDDNDEDGDDERDEEQGEKSKSKKLLRKKQRKSAGSRKETSSDEDSDDYEDTEDEDDDDAEDGEDDESDLDEAPVWERDVSQHAEKSLKTVSNIHKPAWDSGCTVVVALAKGNKLYVGSAGDSRCIVIFRDGQCVPLSFDHKPEDPVEHRRIKKAGGTVLEGRVNGGLNLSRALGDFNYKSSSLDAKAQMITPCPDVRTTELDPNRVEYIFLACDGIWNSMKNQQVANFIRKVAPTVDNDLVKICRAVFKHCLAPGTDGDGTGCDNMTCILARYSRLSKGDFLATKQKDLSTSPMNNEVDSREKMMGGDTEGSKKRPSDEESVDNRTGVKRRCLRLLVED